MASNEARVHFGVASVGLHLPGVGSLKGKRALLNRCKARLRGDLDVSVAEVGETGRWQRATLGVAVAASSESGVRMVLERVTGVIERDPRVVVLGAAIDIDALDGDVEDWLLPHDPLA